MNDSQNDSIKQIKILLDRLKEESITETIVTYAITEQVTENLERKFTNQNIIAIVMIVLTQIGGLSIFLPNAEKTIEEKVGTKVQLEVDKEIDRHIDIVDEKIDREIKNNQQNNSDFPKETSINFNLEKDIKQYGLIDSIKMDVFKTP